MTNSARLVCEKVNLTEIDPTHYLTALFGDLNFSHSDSFERVIHAFLIVHRHLATSHTDTARSATAR